MPKKFKHSDTILLKCKDGYFKSGIGALKCKKGDVWTGGITCSREFLLCCPYSLTKHVFLEKSFAVVVQKGVYTALIARTFYGMYKPAGRILRSLPLFNK